MVDILRATLRLISTWLTRSPPESALPPAMPLAPPLDELRAEEEESLLRAILASSDDDDGPRRAYADWLKAQGDPSRAARADLIRIQCELGPWPEEWLRDEAPALAESQWKAHCRKTEERPDLHARCWELHDLWSQTWSREWGLLVDPLPNRHGWTAPAAGCTYWDRGVPTQAVAWELPERSTRLARNPLPFLRSFCCCFEPDDYPTLAEHLANDDFSRLRELTLLGDASSDRVVQLVARCPSLAKLRSLRLHGGWLSEAGVAVLRHAVFSRGLASLGFSATNFETDALRELLRASEFESLTSLEMSMCRIGDAEIEELLKARWLGRLEHLNLNWGEITDAGVAKLAANPAIQRLDLLTLCGHKIGDDGARALAQSPYLKNVTLLYLYDNRVGRRGRAALQQSRTLNRKCEIMVSLFGKKFSPIGSETTRASATR